MALSLPDGISVEIAPQLGFDLLDAVASADRIVLVDAMCTGRLVGTCVILDGQAIERYSAGASASHTLGIAELMKLAQQLAPQRPPATLHFVGVEGVAFGEYGTELSAEVAAAIPTAVEAVLRIVGASETVLTEAARLSRAEAQRPPSMHDLLRS